jgi:ribosomal protein S18 acetylase RimI-like enzyme
MITAAIACAALVAALCLHVAHRQRSIAERLVDALYRAAAVAYAAAQAADSALCRYRSTRQEIREQHTPMYAEVR